jgi:isoprenylcysteine carboxyl methyltransferase (ICMT) family protein YpbQ
LPELIGLSIVFEAWHTLIFGLRVYAISLSIRIRKEEPAMREDFAGY